MGLAVLEAPVEVEEIEIEEETASVESWLSPLKAVRAYCRDDCCCGQANEVRLCPAQDCMFYGLRLGRKPKGKKVSVLRRIRERCLDCSGHSPQEVRECWDTDCVLYPYRMGKNPNLRGKRKGNPEALRKWRERQAAKIQS